MKKQAITIAVLALVLAAFSAHAYAQGTLGFSGWGTKVGLNPATFNGSDSKIDGVDKKMRIGMTAGAFGTYSFSDLFAVQAELLYSMRGVKYSGTIDVLGTPYEYDATTKLDYLEIPILAKVTFKPAGNLMPSIYCGPDIAFLLSAKEKGSTGGVSVDMDVKDAFKSTDMGITFGGELGWKLIKGMPYLDVRYTMGLTDIPKAGPGEAQPNVKNGVFSIALGYNFK